MIKVDRRSVAEPEYLKRINGARDSEKNRAINYYEENEGEKPTEFREYRNKEVKDQLEELFNSKCAYCESRVEATGYFEIEHWRPKKKVKENSGHNGYCWLVGKWENLLLACRRCNGTGNKGNRFPICKESKYAINSRHDYKSLEKPLLINPCEDEPEEHFIYYDLGLIKGITEKGKVSMNIYGLNREGLLLERKKELMRITRDFDDIIERVKKVAFLSNLIKEIKEKIEDKDKNIIRGIENERVNEMKK